MLQSLTRSDLGCAEAKSNRADEGAGYAPSSWIVLALLASADTDDNPITRTDPSGDYICNGSKSQCRVISQALGDVQKAAGQYFQGSQGQKLLSAITKFYGKEGDKNGVNVGVGNANNNNAVTGTKGKETNITFNLANIRDTGRTKERQLVWKLPLRWLMKASMVSMVNFSGKPSIMNNGEWRNTVRSPRNPMWTKPLTRLLPSGGTLLILNAANPVTQSTQP